MRRRGWPALVGVLLGVLALVGAGCSSNSGGGGGGASATTAAAGGGGGDEVKLTAQGISWSTTTMRLKAGAAIKVEVTNNDKIEHNFSFKQANASQDIEGGDDATVGFTAPAAGTYKFFCKYHPAKMTGTVTVT